MIEGTYGLYGGDTFDYTYDHDLPGLIYDVELKEFMHNRRNFIYWAEKLLVLYKGR